ncbi:MAG: hypothetical protein KF805_13840 [Phycisphaeraceae bacterium]|nr:hypothetical protein [Phycisphaeraceae bacterium]
MQTMKCAAVMCVLAAGTMGAASASGQNLVASYYFEDSLASSTSGAPDLTPIDPLGLNGFATESVFGIARRVYRVDGNASPTSQQAGLTLVTEALVAPRSYSAELVFKFLQRQSAWRLILDTHNRLSDSAFYADPANHLQVYPVAPGTGSTILNNEYHHVVLTVDPGVGLVSSVRAYLDGVPQLSVTTDIMDLSNAPQGLLHIFADNVQAGGQGEFSDADIALFRLYDAALSPEQAFALAQDFFGPSCPCDLNGDGLVDDTDFVIFLAAYNILDCADPAMEPDCPADFNRDGLVEDSDFVVFVAAYNELLCP